MTQYPLSQAEIAAWYRSKQGSLAGSAVSVAEIRETTGPLPSVIADFDGANTMGRIIGWVSGQFDFEALRVSDQKDLFWRHADVCRVDELEGPFLDFLQILQNPPSEK